MPLSTSLYVTVGLYVAATLLSLATLVRKVDLWQRIALWFAIVGFVAHTVWIGTICASTGHPPLTNLPEAASFIAWMVIALELFLFFRYRVHAAAFFVYPFAVLLLSVTAIVREPFAKLDPALRSNLFIAHLLLTTIGTAALIIALAFAMLYRIQDRALKKKSRGAFYEWIPSIKVCDFVTYRALTIGFVIFTLGILTGFLWSYRTTAGLVTLRSKEIGALAAWVMFAALLQSYLSGTFRTQKTLVISAAAFISIIVAILGIHHV